MRNRIGFLQQGLVAALVLGSAGCATRGYVRTQVADLEQRSEARETSMGADIDSAKAEAAVAQNRANDAAKGVETDRGLALGNVGYEPVNRVRVYFAFNKADLTDASRAALDSVRDQLQKNPQYQVTLCGFADPTGTDAYNLQLGERRAEAVLRYLAGGDVAELSRFQTVSFGEDPPDAERGGWGATKEVQRQVEVVMVERTAKIGTEPMAQNGGQSSNQEGNGQSK